jgi:hypothetical protein
MEAITTMAQVLRNSTVTPEILPFNPYKKATTECDVTIIGKDYSSHQLCKSLLRAPNSPETSIAQEPCLFYSYGIQNDYTFDTELSNQYDCFGFLFDPSVSHNSHPGQKLLFMGLGAPMLHHDNFENPGVWVNNGGHQPNLWQSIGPAGLARAMRHKHIDVLKMDCEGCEYALARDIVLDDPRFLQKVEQFTIEVHISQAWVKGSQHVYNLGLLYYMLFKEGFFLALKSYGNCEEVGDVCMSYSHTYTHTQYTHIHNTHTYTIHTHTHTYTHTHTHTHTHTYTNGRPKDARGNSNPATRANRCATIICLLNYRGIGGIGGIMG